MIKYDSHKPSGIEWLGDIPSHWEVKKLKYISKIKTGEKDTENKVDDGRYPFFVRSDKIEKINSYSFDGEAVLTAGDGVGVGKVFHYFNGKFEYHQRVYKISNFKSVEGKFFYYYLKENFYKEVLKLSAKSTVDSIRLPMLANFFVAIPLKKEQEDIANFLDKKLEQVDNYISKQKELIELLKEKKSSLINQAVTKGLDPKVEYKESGIEWLGKIPKHWEVEKLSRSFKNIGSGTTPSSSETKYHQNGTVNWINTGDLNDSYLYQCKNKITEYAMKNTSSLKIYPKNSLIIAMYGATIGKTSISKIEACVNQACCVLSNSYVFEIKFMFYSFIGHRKYIISLSYGGGQPNISQETIKSLKFCCPPKQEQQQIVEYIEKESSKIDKVITTKEDEIKLLDEYKQSLISSAVTGKIKVS